MAYDFKYITLCDHRVKDRVFLEPDGSTLKLTLPATTTEVVVLRNGKKVSSDDGLYGWSLQKDLVGSSDFYNSNVSTSQDIQTKRSVVFSTPLRSLDDVFDVFYYVPLEYCRKCDGNKVINDWEFNQAGRIEIVEDEEKLVQELTKLLLTSRFSHPEHSWYGASLQDLIASKFLVGLEIRVAADIQENIERFVKLQLKQSLFQSLSPNERVREVLGITSERGTGDLEGTLFINIRLRTDARTIADVSFGIQPSSVFANNSI